MRLSLRSLFYLIVAAAIAVGWGIEHVRLATRLAKIKERAGSGNLRDGMSIGISVVRSRRANDLRNAGEEELLQKLYDWGPGSQKYDDALYQVCLSEMLRRGHRQKLREQYNERRAEWARPKEGSTGMGAPGEGTMLLPFLTAVRRAEGEPDPVRIRLAYQPGASATDPPLIVPSIENVDSQQQEIYLHTTGDVGPRRNGCWQIQFTNAAGRHMPLARKVECTGGFAGFQTLEFGERYECDPPLDARSYVRPPKPGKYKLQVLFCTVEISRDPERTGLIVIESEPVDVIVTSSAAQPGTAVIPLLALLYGALLATAAAIVIRRWRRCAQPLQQLASWRDATAWAVLIALSLAWHCDVTHLGQQIEQSQLDEDAEWLWKRVE